MFNNYLKSAGRNLSKQKFLSVTLILGLALGYATFLFISQYTAFERSFEDHVPDRAQIYRVVTEKYRGGEKIVSGAESYVGCGPAFANAIPEIKSYTRTHNTASRMNAVVSHQPEGKAERIAFKLRDFYYADSSFLAFFGYGLIKGDPKTALNKPLTAVITESLAQKYFGEEDPMGKTILYQDEHHTYDEHVITGIIEDTPATTHLPFSLLLSYNTFDTRPYPFNYKNSWKARKSYTYLKLGAKADPKVVEHKMAEIFMDNKEIAEGQREKLYLQPLSNVHFSKLDEEPTITRDRSVLSLLDTIAILILAIAIINYINLSVSSLIKRTVNVGVKKVFGASKGQLMMQHYAEAFLVNVIALMLAIALLYILWPYLVDLIGLDINSQYLFDGSLYLKLMLVALLGIMLAGTVPAGLVASLDPVKALLGKGISTRGRYQRLILTIGQFAISFILLAATVIVYKQLRYMQDQNLGLDIDATLVLRTPGILPSQDREEVTSIYNRFLNKINQHAAIKGTAASLTIPGHEKAFRTAVQLRPDDKVATLRFNGVGPHFINTFEMELLAGRNFKAGNPYDIDSAILISKLAANDLGFKTPEDAIGTIIEVPAFGYTCEVIGVVNDYRLASVKDELEPTAFLYFEPVSTNFFTLKVEKAAAIPFNYITGVWNETFSGNPLDYFFLNDYFNRQYSTERLMVQLFALLGLVAILLSIMGLIGLSVFTTRQRIKEISVRKVLGSSTFSVYTLVLFSFMKLIFIAVIVGTPVIYYFANEWLNEFQIKINLGPIVFIIPAVALLAIAVFAVSIQTWRAASTNPAQVLRAE